MCQEISNIQPVSLACTIQHYSCTVPVQLWWARWCRVSSAQVVEEIRRVHDSSLEFESHNNNKYHHVSSIHPRFQKSQTVGGEASPAGCEEIRAPELQEGDEQAEGHAGLPGRDRAGGRGAGEDSQPHRGPRGQTAPEAESGRRAR